MPLRMIPENNQRKAGKFMNTAVPNAAHYQGADFYKCALQVNSYTAAREYQHIAIPNEETYNQGILENCRRNEIQVVGLADHGSIENAETLRELLRNSGIDVFPGFEICSSEQAHFVCLFHENTTYDQLTGYIARLQIDTRQPTDPSKLNAENIFRIIREVNGVVYAAHCTRENGVLSERLHNVWTNELLTVAQIPHQIEDLKSMESGFYYDILKNNAQHSPYHRDNPMTLINARDVYSPEDLEKTSSYCWIKMTNPTFESFAMALLDPQSRIRLGEPTQPYSYIRSIRWTGGFFGETELGFSPYLNTAIGGRGTGKSTLIESIRYALGLPYRGTDERSLRQMRQRNLDGSKVVLEIQSKAQTGNIYTVSRRYGEDPVVKNEQGEVSRLLPSEILPGAEILGQNEILEIEKDETATRDLVCRFFPDSDTSEKDLLQARKKLSKNREKLLEAMSAHENLDAEIAREQALKERFAQYQKLGIGEKMKNVQKLEREKGLQEDIKEQTDAIEDWLDSYQGVFKLAFFQREYIESLPSQDLIKKIEESFSRLEQHAKKQVAGVRDAFGKVRKEQQAIQSQWKKRHEQIRTELDRALAQLPEQEGRSGRELGLEYAAIVTQLTKIDKQKKKYGTQQSVVQQFRSERDSLLENYRDLAFSRYKMMCHAADDINKKLSGKVKINIKQKHIVQELKNFLCRLDGIGPIKVAWLDQVGKDIDLRQWSKWIEENDSEAFVKKFSSITKNTAEKFCKMGNAQRLELEEIELKDRVEIQLNISHDLATERFEPLKHLSTGQKCTAILNLLLLDREAPLIVDQPEDNLDNAFIADHIVRDLRTFKFKRQFLFATHNPNIPIFGDAELIAVLDISENKANFTEIGAVDRPEVKEKVVAVLEGGQKAFEDRKLKYGF